MENQLILVGEASETDRINFYKKTYQHVAGAILAFTLLEAIFIKTIPEIVVIKMLSTNFVWLFIIGLFWLGSMLSSKLAFSDSRKVQYVGLGLLVVLEAIVFLPILYILLLNDDGGAVLQQAGLITLFMFAGLTAIVFMTNADFTFLRSALIIGGFLSLGVIVVGAIFGFNLGLWFSLAMVVLASGSILYQTSMLKDRYDTSQYVGASLQLFASIMLLFWYILRILMSRRS